MESFAIFCPSCGKYTEVKKGFLGTGGFVGTGVLGTGLLGKKEITCSCNAKINMYQKFKTRDCPSCGASVILDESKGESAACAVCKNPINTVADIAKNAEIDCPKCSCNILVDKTQKYCDCPICGAENIDVQQRIGLANIAASGIASVIKYEGDNETFIWKHPIGGFL